MKPNPLCATCTQKAQAACLTCNKSYCFHHFQDHKHVQPFDEFIQGAQTYEITLEEFHRATMLLATRVK